jgi:replicative DNA helicase
MRTIARQPELPRSEKFPANLDGERATLAACVEEPGILNAVLAEGLTPTDFSVSDHRELFEVILQMCDKGLPVTLISVVEYSNISAAMLSDLIFGVVLVESHIVHYVRIVKRKAALRRLLHLSDWLSEEAVAAGADPDSLVIQLKLKISELETNMSGEIGDTNERDTTRAF